MGFDPQISLPTELKKRSPLKDITFFGDKTYSTVT